MFIGAWDRMETKRSKAMVKLDTLGVEHARMMKSKFNQNLWVEPMDKNKRRIYSCDGWAPRIQQTKISLTFDFLSKAWSMSLTFCLLFRLLVWDILSDSVHRISIIITYFLRRVKLSPTGDFLVRNTSSRQKMDIFFASTESLTGGRTILT